MSADGRRGPSRAFEPRDGAGTVIARFRAALEARDLSALRGAFTSDAVLDANLPSWRLERHGPAAIVDQFEAWYPRGPAEFVEWHERPTGWGAVVECVERQVEQGRELHFRQVLLFQARGRGLSGLTLYCTGAWDRATLDRHALEERRAGRPPDAGVSPQPAAGGRA